MTPTLLFPAALAALAALAIPLLIHLARRTEQRPTDFAALRWLSERPRPRHRPRLDEWPLLAARLLLLALLALFLARPAVFGAGDRRPVVAVAPGIDPTGVATGDARAVWLAPGFPDVTATPTGSAPIASLIRQLDADLPPATPLRIVVPRILQGVDAERPHLSRRVTWQVAPGAMPAPPRPRAPAIAVEGSSRYIAAAATAWGPRAAAGTTALITTVPGALSATAQAILDKGGTVLVGAATPIGAGEATPVWRDATGVLVERVATPRGRLLRFTRPLAPAAMPVLLDPAFPARLRALFAADAAPARVAAVDYAPTAGARAYPRAAIDLSDWLALAIAAVFAIERLLATRSRRAAAP